MKQITVRDVPDRVLAFVREEAAERHQSLSGFVRSLLVAEVERLQEERRRRRLGEAVQSALSDYRASASWLSGVSSEEVVAAVRGVRDEH